MKKSIWKITTLALVVVLLIVGLVFATEQDASDNVMNMLLGFKDKGFVNVRGERRGYLSSTQQLKQRIRMYGEQEYLAIVAGDKDLKDISIKVLDKKGKKLASTKVSDGEAHLTIKPPKKDKYTFRVETPGAGGYYHFSLVTK